MEFHALPVIVIIIQQTVKGGGAAKNKSQLTRMVAPILNFNLSAGLAAHLFAFGCFLLPQCPIDNPSCPPWGVAEEYPNVRKFLISYPG